MIGSGFIDHKMDFGLGLVCFVSKNSKMASLQTTGKRDIASATTMHITVLRNVDFFIGKDITSTIAPVIIPRRITPSPILPPTLITTNNN